MKDFLIPLSYNPIPNESLMAVLEVYSSRNHIDLIADFEKKICSLVGATYAVALNSGTAAIHLGLKALNVGKDDVVMVSSFTYVASVNPICYLGAIPFFIDSGEDDWNMDPILLEDAILQGIKSGKKPKAILVVHTYGMPAKMNEIMRISARYNIPVLEDAAEGLGSTYEGIPVGTLTEVGIFSFNNNKLLTTYGGGMLVTNNKDIAEKVNRWSGQSRDNLPFYEHREIGYNYKMGALNAAVGLAQIDSLADKITQRRKVYQTYRKLLVDKVGWQDESCNVFSNRWMTTVRFLTDVDVSEVQGKLFEKKIETRPVWKPMHLQPVFKEFQAMTNRSAEKLFISGLCLPSGDGITLEEAQEICNVIEPTDQRH